MIIKGSKKKRFFVILTILIISFIIVASILTNGFSQFNSRTNTEAIILQGLKQSATPTNATNAVSINETKSLNATNSYDSYAFVSINTTPLNIVNSTPFSHPDMSGFFFRPPDNICQGQIAESIAAVFVSLDSSKFITYTYGGYSVQQPDSNQFIFSFPDNTSEGQIAGSDALTWTAYTIQKLDFDAAFIAPNTNASGFDEMVIFATSNTNTYKGTEFGIRMDLKDGFIYGYLQEPNGDNSEINFNMQKLMLNDGVTHHYTLIMAGSEISFLIDGTEYGNLSFQSNTDYSNLNFSIIAVVHRFTDGWDSEGDGMTTGNFSLNQQ
jgi:hypothetical protein